MSDGDEVTGWITAAVMLGIGVTAVVATLVNFGSNPFGLTVICLIAAYLIWNWIKDDLDQRR